MTERKFGLNPEQFKWLMENISSDDKETLGKVMKDCTSEMLVSRCLPIAAGTMILLGVARKRLPEKYWIGPKGNVPFFLLVGVGSFCAANIFSMGSCSDKVRPVLQELYQKVSIFIVFSTILDLIFIK